VSPLRALSCTVVSATWKVVTGNETLRAPAGTVTLAGTLAAPGSRLDSVTTVPPAGAAAGTVTDPVADVPPGTLPGLTVKVLSVAGGGVVPSGLTVRSALTVTPPPVTDTVTTVVVETDVGSSCRAPRSLPAGTVTALDRNGSTVGLLLLTCSDWSKEAIADTVTEPWTDPADPVVVAGNSVSETGFGAGITTSGVCTLPPLQLAVIVAVVRVATSTVGMLNDAEGLPAATLTVAGGRAAGELLERFTTAPAGGACPLSIRIAPADTPPLVVDGVSVSVFSDGGRTFIGTVTDDDPRVAVTFTTVGAVTCPIWNGNDDSSTALPAGTVTEAGTGTTDALLLVSRTTAPPLGAAAVS
jgi:hypothetical protein